jgi:predicted metal-dependent enzyme (double-stranded beta helix superfamily)
LGQTTNEGERFDAFVRSFTALIDSGAPERQILKDGARLLAALVANDDWLSAPHAAPAPDGYRQYLLHRDPQSRFAVVSFVWGPGQGTPIHDHTVWGLIGVLRGAEHAQAYRFVARDRLAPAGDEALLERGAVDAVSPSLVDIHRVRNAFGDRVSISIHVYGADIGALERSTYTEQGARQPFVSGYSQPAAIPA